jgi:hypothetical protein
MDRGATGACRSTSSSALQGSAPCHNGTGSKRAVWEPADGLTWGGEAVRRASGDGERNLMVTVGVEVLRERR